ncbi:MAG TPA: hypothetical protein VM242_06690 [Acidimicrobiales bacterium]|jgi:hypothetical protein|nr:hypothetical protein [Acidimicrobiales bacterium]
MIRTALIAWVAASVPCSVLLGRMCREASAPLTGWGGDAVPRPVVVAPPRAVAHL